MRPTRWLRPLLLVVAIAACKGKAAAPAKDNPPPAPAPAAPAPAAPAVDAAAPAPTPTPAPTAGAVPKLDDTGVGGVKNGFKGGLAELRAALPGLDVKEAWIPGDEGAQSEGYEVRSGNDVVFTLIPNGDQLLLETMTPQLVTADGLHTGSTFPELAAVKRKHTCEGITAEGYYADCTFDGGKVQYELTLDDEPAKDKAKLEKQLAKAYVNTIRMTINATVPTPKLGEPPPP